MPQCSLFEKGEGASSPWGRREDRWRRSPFGICLQIWRFANFENMIEFHFLWDIVSVNISIFIYFTYIPYAYGRPLSLRTGRFRSFQNHLFSCNIHTTVVMLTFRKNAGYAYLHSRSATPMRIPIANPQFAGVPGRFSWQQPHIVSCSRFGTSKAKIS